MAEQTGFGLEELSRKQYIRLRGAEYEYEVETGGTSDSVTVIDKSSEAIVLYSASLERFVEELKAIRDRFFSGEG